MWDDLTFDANTKEYAMKSSKFSASDTMSSTHRCLSPFFKRRRTEDHTSATARWTSGLHFVRLALSCDQVMRKTSLFVSVSSVWGTEGSNTCLKIASSVPSKAESASGDIRRGRKSKRQDMIDSYPGAIVERKSSTNFCSRLRQEHSQRESVSIKDRGRTRITLSKPRRPISSHNRSINLSPLSKSARAKPATEIMVALFERTR